MVLCMDQPTFLFWDPNDPVLSQNKEREIDKKKGKNKLGLSWAKLKFSLVRVVTADKIEVIVGVQYLSGGGRVDGVKWK